MDKLADFAWYRRCSGGVETLEHPAGPVLPLHPETDGKLLPAGLQTAIREGRYCEEQIACLKRAIRPGDRVLDLGAGLGVTAVVAARQAKRVVAIEADPRIVPVAQRLLEASGVGSVAYHHGLPAIGRKGCGPVFLRADFRRSSRSPGGSPWQAMGMAPFLPINVILADQQIDLVVCDLPFGAANILTSADLKGVDRILLTRQPDTVTAQELDDSLAVRGFFSDPQCSQGRTTLYRRLQTGRWRAESAGAEVAITG